MRGLLKVSDVAVRVGVLPSTIRYYQALGLLRSVAVSPGGYHLFDESAVESFNEIRRLKTEERLTLEEIRARLGGSGPSPTGLKRRRAEVKRSRAFDDALSYDGPVR